MYALLLISILNFDIRGPPRLSLALVRCTGCNPVLCGLIQRLHGRDLRSKVDLDANHNYAHARGIRLKVGLDAFHMTDI